MSARTINLAAPDEHGLCCLEIDQANGSEGSRTVDLFRLSQEEVADLERQCHERLAEMD